MTHLWENKIPYGDPIAPQNVFDRSGNLKMAIQDQWTDVVDFEANIILGDVTLAATVTMDTRTLTLEPGHGTIVGEHLCFRENEPTIVNNNPDDILYIGRTQQCEVLTVVGDVITIDTPFEYAFTPDAYVCRQRVNLNVDGSTTPVVASIYPTSPTKWDIIRFTVYIQDTTAMTDDLFGNLTALNKGVVFRKKNEDIHTLFNAKTNSEFKVRNYDLTYFSSAQAGPGVYSMISRRTMGGQDKNGVVLRLDGSRNDKFEVVIQDDLTALSSFRVIAQGHIVDPL